MADAKNENPEEQLADVIGFALAGRPERVEDGMLALAPADLKKGVRDVREVLAALALAAAPEKPSADLRSKILASVEKKRAKKALLVIDMINDHLEPGTLLEVPRARAVVPALKQRIAEARRQGIPIVYVVDEHDPAESDLEFDAWGTHAVKGTSGVEIWNDLAPESGDRIVKKPTYSAFHQSNLSSVLDELKVDTLVLTGCLTEIGIMATATDAMQQGFAVEVPPDSQAGSCVEAEMAAMSTMNVMAPFGPARRARLERIAA